MVQINFNNLIKSANSIIKRGWIKGLHNGTGNAGLTFENLLGKPNHNFEISDYDGIEIKTKLYGKEKYMTLFNATPDSHLFEIKRLHSLYGYPDKTHPQYNVFNVSIYANKRKFINKFSFAWLEIDRTNKKIILKIYNKRFNTLDDETSWSFEMLEEKLFRKLQYLFFIRADHKNTPNGTFFQYRNYKCYKLKSFEHFLSALESGYIRITFTIGVYKSGKKLGEIHDHGTAFNIKFQELDSLFSKYLP